jgi:hypothetical protein
MPPSISRPEISFARSGRVLLRIWIPSATPRRRHPSPPTASAWPSSHALLLASGNRRRRRRRRLLLSGFLTRSSKMISAPQREASSRLLLRGSAPSRGVKHAHPATSDEVVVGARG